MHFFLQIIVGLTVDRTISPLSREKTRTTIVEIYCCFFVCAVSRHLLAIAQFLVLYKMCSLIFQCLIGSAGDLTKDDIADDLA